jgi:hypothetical protein
LTFGHWSSSNPSSRAITFAGSGAASSSTTSQLPRAATASSSSVTTSRTARSWLATAFGVKRRATRRRRSVWRGSSSPIIELSDGMLGR